jgi:hypothetical protein
MQHERDPGVTPRISLFFFAFGEKKMKPTEIIVSGPCRGRNISLAMDVIQTMASPTLLAQHTNKGVNGKFLRIRVQPLLTGLECREAEQHFRSLVGWHNPSVRVTDYTPKRFRGTIRVTEVKLYKEKNIQPSLKEHEPEELIAG